MSSVKTVTLCSTLFLLALVGVLGTSRQGSLPVQAAGTTPMTTSQEPTDRPAERYQGSFFDGTSGAQLARLSVATFPEDKVFVFPDPALGLGSEIRVYRAQPVLVKDGKHSKLYRSWATTVDGLLTEQGIELGEKDVIVPARDVAVPIQDAPVAITITRVAESELVTNTPIAYTTKYIDDEMIEKGIVTTEQKGAAGNLKKTFLVRREDGDEVWRKETKHEVTKDPVTEIIRRGTKILMLDEGKATFYSLGGRQCGAGRFSAAHKTLPKGTRVRVINIANGKSVVVTIDDRGPYGPGRVIDLSCDAFSTIASTGAGIVDVKVEKE